MSVLCTCYFSSKLQQKARCTYSTSFEIDVPENYSQKCTLLTVCVFLNLAVWVLRQTNQQLFMDILKTKVDVGAGEVHGIDPDIQQLVDNLDQAIVNEQARV